MIMWSFARPFNAKQMDDLHGHLTNDLMAIICKEFSCNNKDYAIIVFG